jgi:uncharacterized protein
MFELTTAFTIGLIGSLHCVGMCGPIVVALPLGHKSLIDRSVGGLLYNLGRTITYGAMGGLFGLLGKGIGMAGFQQWASILMGVVMILGVLFPFLFRAQQGSQPTQNRVTYTIVQRLKALFGNHSKHNLLIIGLLNGLLPCGLVYVAIAGAIQTGDVVMGILFMIAFGFGTIPLLLTVSLAGQMVGAQARKRLARVIPAFVVILGIVFILRGMSLGIPYISPDTRMLTPEKEVTPGKSCCVEGDKEAESSEVPQNQAKPKKNL